MVRTGIRAIVGTNNLVVCLHGVGVRIHARINYVSTYDRRSTSACTHTHDRGRCVDDRTHRSTKREREREREEGGSGDSVETRDKLSGSRSRR